MKSKGIITICILVTIVVVESILLIINYTDKNKKECLDIKDDNKTTTKKEETKINNNGVHYTFSYDKLNEDGDYILDFFNTFKIGDKDILSNFNLDKKDAEECEACGTFLNNVTEYYDGFIIVETGHYYDLMDFREAYYIFDLEGNLVEKLEPYENKNSGIYGYAPTEIYYNSISKKLVYDYENYTSEEGLLPDLVYYETKKEAYTDEWYENGKIPKSACNAISKYLKKDLTIQYEMKYKGNGQFEKAVVTNKVTLEDDYDYAYELGLCGLGD